MLRAVSRKSHDDSRYGGIISLIIQDQLKFEEEWLCLNKKKPWLY